MKKTLTVNLGGTVYHIDEDAYKLLDTYLSNLRIHFCREEGAEEIVHDMELRISELFTDRLRDGKQVITIEDVEEIIAQMGKPEDLGDEADGGGETSKDGSTYSQTAKGPRREEGAEEIVHDMELRISELFTDRLRDGKQVITIEDVEEIIAQMGKPEDLGDEADGGGETSKDGSTYSQTAKGPRRLFRDSDNKVLGGVASGLAAYFGWDPTWVRIIFLILGISLKGFVIAYIIAWIVIPLARTVPEKLAMRGAKINVENIGRTVTDNFEKVNEYVHSGKPHSALQRIGEGIVGVAGALIKFILIVLAICCAPIVFVIFVVCFAMLMVATGLIAATPAVLYEVLPAVDWNAAGASPTVTIGLAVSGILVIGIPIIGLIHILMRHFGGWQPMSTVTRIIFIVLWFIALSAGFGFFFQIHHLLAV